MTNGEQPPPMSQSGRANPQTESVRTVLTAGAANIVAAAAKVAAGLASGSSAMLAEAGHSVGDTVNEVLLLTGLRRGARGPDKDHPFGHGSASFFWALVASVSTFVVGAGFAVLEGESTLRHGADLGATVPAYLVLVIAFFAESTSLRRSVNQITGGARRVGVTRLDYLRRTPQTALIAVTLEDVAALVGILLAGLGLGLTQITGTSVWDGLASIAIGALLAVIALTLAAVNVSLLIGRAASPGLQAAVYSELEGLPSVKRVLDLRTMYLGPSSVLVAAHVDFDDEASGARLESTADEAERRLTQRFPNIRHVYLDPTPPRTRKAQTPHAA